MAKLSVIVVTLNEEKNIERCLDSVRWADEIVVVDSFSTDRTVELSRKYTENVFQYVYPGYSKQVERGMNHSTGEWVFILDADEEVTAELGASIRTAILSDQSCDGYFVNRKVYVFGKWIEHCGWFPDWQFRLVKRGMERAEHKEIHGAFVTEGKTGKLEGLLHHYTYETIGQYLEKMNDYTSLQVSNKLTDDPEYSPGWTKIVFSPWSHFIQMFITNGGYKDGFHGFFLSALDALYSLSFYAKLWEYRYRKNMGTELPPVTNSELQAIKSP